MDTSTHAKKLEEEKELIVNELSAIAHFNESTGDWEAKPAEPADNADQNDAADDQEDSIERQALVADLENRYRNLKRALEKIEAGTYGTCELCQKPIEENRLEANPAARTCIADKEREAELPL